MNSSNTLKHYQCLRSHRDVHVFVVCYADRFFDDVPKHVRDLGPWRGDCRGNVNRLKPEIRVALAQDGFVLVNAPEAVFNPEA